MNEEEIIEFIDQLYGVKREYYNTVRVKNTENIITAIKSAIILYQHEKEKNKKLEEDKKVCEIMEKSHKKEIDELIEKINKQLGLINNLAKAVIFMGSNAELTVEDVIREFSKNIDLQEDFYESWEKEQQKESKLKDKVIDLMAEDLDNGIDFNNCVLDKGFTICNKEIDCVKCVKEYYFREARGE